MYYSHLAAPPMLLSEKLSFEGKSLGLGIGDWDFGLRWGVGIVDCDLGLFVTFGFDFWLCSLL